jgi:hypothetical protein
LLDLQSVSVVITAVSVSLAATYYILTIRNTQKNMRTTLETRQAQFFMQIYMIFHQTEFFENFTDIVGWKWEDYDDFMEKYGPRTNPKAFDRLGSIGAFFEGIGVLVHRDLIDASLVGQLMSRHIIMFWEKIAPISLEMRRRLKMPVDVWLEYLYNEIKPMMENQQVKIAE